MNKSLLQTQEWVDLKVTAGWKSHQVEGIFVLEKTLFLGQKFLYVPEVSWGMAKKSLGYLKDFAKNQNAIFLRLEVLDEYRADIIRVLEKNGFIKAFEETQPEWRQIIDISQTEEEILNQMKPKGRYNIRLALKHGVKKSQNINRQSQIDIFYRLYKETAKFQNISRRNKKYFESMAKILPENEIDIIIAEYQGEPLSVLLLAFYDGVASYLYGGTSRENKQVMAPYLAHWEAIREARTRDCYKYDLLAVSPEANGGEPGEKRGHKYENLTRFKEQFGGRKVNIVGSWDYIIRPTWYKMFKAAEKIRR